jgi:hypothetical protein
MQGFWSVLKKIAQGTQTGINIGKQVGLFEAGPPGVGAQGAPSEFEMQGFWSVLKKIAQGAQTGINVGKQVGLFEAGPPGVGAQGAPSEFEMQGFWSVLKKIAQGTQTGINVGKQLGVFEAGPPGAGAQGAPGGGVATQGQLVALLQQAMPALQAIAQQGQPQTAGYASYPGYLH